jgi:hypothetical protein
MMTPAEDTLYGFAVELNRETRTHLKRNRG